MREIEDKPDWVVDEEGLSAALHASLERYCDRNPVSRERHARAAETLPGGNTRTVLFYEPYPLAIARGAGCTLWDVDGHAYLDFLGEYTAGVYGHSHPVIRAAIDAALDDGINLSGHNLLEIRLAQLLCERFVSLKRLRFTNSGTEANLMAIAAAKAFTGRSQIVVFLGGYHGGVLTFAKGHSPVNVPHDFILAPYNDLRAASELIQSHGPQLAAVLVEPMQGAAGCIPGDEGFLRGLQDATRAAGALLIFDEVMTSRLGFGGRQAELGITPDLTTLGKYLGGGMSFGAFGGREDIMMQFDPRRPGHLPHAGTFNNNVLSMAAGIAGLERVLTQREALRLNALGESLRSELNRACKDAAVPFQFTGLGSLMNFHPSATPLCSVADLAPLDSRWRDLFFFFMLERGIYVARRGFVALSLPIGEAEVDRFVEAFREFTAAMAPLVRAGRST